METDCIVHNRKCLSKFHGTVNQLRQSNEFSISVLQQLPKRCCSCNGHKGESSFSYDHLHRLCHDIQLSMETPSIKPNSNKSIDYVTLAFPPTFDFRQRHYKTGLFVGKEGKNIRSVEKKFRVQLNICNPKSRKHLVRVMREVQEKNETKCSTDLWILITLADNKSDPTSMEQVKQSLEEQWKNAIIFPKRIRLKEEVIVPTPLAKDDRWKPKKENKKYQQKRKEKDSFEQQQQQQEKEVPPQPSLRPISMPKELTKSRKH